MSQIAFIEPIAGGHHGTYLRWLWECVNESGKDSVLVTSTDATASADFQLNLAKTGLMNRVIHLAAPASVTGRSMMKRMLSSIRWANWLRYASASTNLGSLLFLPYSDMFLHQLSLLPNLTSGRHWSGIAMSPTFHHPECLGFRQKTKRDHVKEELFGRLLRQRKLVSLFCIDPLLPEFCRTKFGQVAKKLQYFPDPVEIQTTPSRDLARAALNIPDDAFVVLCYGSIALRKGLPEIVGCLSTNALSKAIIFVIAGQPDAEAKSLLFGESFRPYIAAKRIVLHLHHCSANIESELFAAADLAWVIYPGFYQMSGIVARAVTYGTPFIGTSEGLIDWYATRFQSGVAPKSVSSKDITDTLNRLANNSEEIQIMREKALLHINEFSINTAKRIVSNNIEQIAD